MSLLQPGKMLPGISLKSSTWVHFQSLLNLKYSSDTLAWEDLNSERFPTLIRGTECSQPVNGHVYILGADGDSSPPIKLWSYDIRNKL